MRTRSTCSMEDFQLTHLTRIDSCHLLAMASGSRCQFQEPFFYFDSSKKLLCCERLVIYAFTTVQGILEELILGVVSKVSSSKTRHRAVKACGNSLRALQNCHFNARVHNSNLVASQKFIFQYSGPKMMF